MIVNRFGEKFEKRLKELISSPLADAWDWHVERLTPAHRNIRTKCCRCPTRQIVIEVILVDLCLMTVEIAGTKLT